MAELKSTQK